MWEVLEVFVFRISSGRRGFFFHPCNWRSLQQNLAIASSSKFLCLFSYSRRSADVTNRWPLQKTLTCDLDLQSFHILSHNSCFCWTKNLQIFTDCSLGYGHSLNAKISLESFTNSFYGYIMFCEILWKCICGHNFWTKPARMIILSLNERSSQALYFILLT